MPRIFQKTVAMILLTNKVASYFFSANLFRRADCLEWLLVFSVLWWTQVLSTVTNLRQKLFRLYLNIVKHSCVSSLSVMSNHANHLAESFFISQWVVEIFCTCSIEISTVSISSHPRPWWNFGNPDWLAFSEKFDKILGWIPQLIKTIVDLLEQSPTQLRTACPEDS